jgi:hypothetical protein
MGLEEFKQPNPYLRFIESIASSNVTVSGTNLHEVGDDQLLWHHHGSSRGVPITKSKRNKLPKNQKELLHLMLDISKKEFDGLVNDDRWNMNELKNRFPWYVIPDAKLDRYTKENDEYYWIEKTDYSEISQFKKDSMDLLE